MKLAIRVGLSDSLSGYMLKSIKDIVSKRIIRGDLGWEVVDESAPSMGDL
jgi:hypothetical protein